MRVLTGDWQQLQAEGPFDLLVLDGGGQGTGASRPVELQECLQPGGVLVVDDLTPATSWPPTWQGQPDEARLHWFSHPDLCSSEVRLSDELSTLLALHLPSTPGPEQAWTGS